MHHVTTAEAVLDLLAKRETYCDAPDVGLVLLDLRLPQTSGLQLLHRLKRSAKTKKIPVVVLTSSESPDDYQESYRLHANAVVRKPESLKQLVDLVNAVDAFWMQLVTFGPAQE